MKFTKTIWMFLLTMLILLCFAGCGNQDIDDHTEPTEPTLNMGIPDCAHIFGEWEQAVESGCTQKGTQLRSCSLCGKQEQKDTPAVGHFFNNGICAACGSSAPNCQHQITERIVLKKANCTEIGYANCICTICDAVISVEELSARGHEKLTAVVLWEATCTQDGRVNEVCLICGEVTGYHIIPALGHTDTEWVVLKESTCTEEGHRQKKCKSCGMVVEEIYTDAPGHSFQQISKQEPTCTQDGWLQYVYCESCDYSELEKNKIPAHGHKYTGGICGVCGAKDSGFVITQIPGLPKVEHNVSYPVEEVFFAPAAQTLQYTFSIMVAEDRVVHQITAGETGIYYFWLSRLYSGNTLKLYIKDDLGHIIFHDTNVANEEGISANLEQGKTYTVELVTRTCVKPGEFVLNIGCQKATMDISAHSAAADAITFGCQTNVYTFTPAVDGVYYLWFSKMVDGFTVDINVCNALGQSLHYVTGCFNGSGILLEDIIAGQQYTVKVICRNGLGEYTLNLGKQQATVDISKYTVIRDSLYYNGQVNRYQFIVPSDGKCRIELSNIPNDLAVTLCVYNSLGEELWTVFNAQNGDGYTLNDLKAGTSYTITVSHKSSPVPYTLCVYADKQAVELTDNTGALDCFEHLFQTNNYTFTAKAGGTYRIAITGLDEDVSVGLYIYDASGTWVLFDRECYNGEYLELQDLAPGATYTIKVCVNKEMTAYLISVQQ